LREPDKERMTNTSKSRFLLLAIFGISGFSGLIYESIWSHYLKLFLGHAAYAQALVLAIFMGGMAIGAWLAGRHSARWRSLLLGYAVAEGAIGILAFVFHRVFEATTGFALDQLLPALGSPVAAAIVKWTIGTLLILPQSILLGTTFPLMSGAFIRRFPDRPGFALAILYFINSIGAAVGVLVSGFLLIQWVGLPGTILTGGLLNVMIAVTAWLAARRTELETLPAIMERHGVPSRPERNWYFMLLGIALLTGLSSFIYEIGWIRMLSLVLGSSTHAFELMLAAFILGIALGGLWIRRRIDASGSPTQFLGWIQLFMGLFALLSIPVYDASFDVMRWLLHALQKTEPGYALFNGASHFIALVVMLPATFCAGMTLPLITYGLIRRGHGERSIGMVYASNTFGAILGVAFSLHAGLPVLGLKGLIVLGSGIDIALGIVLLWLVATRGQGRLQASLAAALGVAAIALVSLFVRLDPVKMASGVYRAGEYLAQGSRILYHQDGKTASVDLVQLPSNRIMLTTNGKPDASVNVGEDPKPGPDEVTMVMIGFLPLAYHADAKTAAVIGMGSGMTTHTLLATSALERVDTIEIEPAMIEAARGFGQRTERAFSDPRSHIYIEDAKTFFSTRNSRYDLIASEPSNPWVSGVASLFSEEFYARVERHLKPGGVFVQWLQTYEIDLPLVASVAKAMRRHFADYAVYLTDDFDLVFVARHDGSLGEPDPKLFRHPVLSRELARVDIHSDRDLATRLIGHRRLLAPLFESQPVPANSDFFPILDLNAARTRYLEANARELTQIRDNPLPLIEMLDAPITRVRSKDVTATPHNSAVSSVALARALTDYLLTGSEETGRHIPVVTRLSADVMRAWVRTCTAPVPSIDGFLAFVDNSLIVAARLDRDEARTYWRRVAPTRCLAGMSPVERQWMGLLQAIAERDAGSMAAHAEALLAQDMSEGAAGRKEFLLSAAMLGNLALGRKDKAWALYRRHAGEAIRTRGNSLTLRLLAAHVHYSDVLGLGELQTGRAYRLS
jgi:spermidine synthase